MLTKKIQGIGKAPISSIYARGQVKKAKHKSQIKRKPLVVTKEVALLQLLAPGETYNHIDVRDRSNFYQAIWALNKSDDALMYSLISHKDTDFDDDPKGFTIYRIA